MSDIELLTLIVICASGTVVVNRLEEFDTLKLSSEPHRSDSMVFVRPIEPAEKKETIGILSRDELPVGFVDCFVLSDDHLSVIENFIRMKQL